MAYGHNPVLVCGVPETQTESTDRPDIAALGMTLASVMRLFGFHGELG